MNCFTVSLSSTIKSRTGNEGMSFAFHITAEGATHANARPAA
jgi:hypothetical protein